MATKKEPDTGNSDRELTITRLIKAPRDLMFEVWTDPDHIKHWWGPEGFTNTIYKMEVRPGGEWDFVMHGPDGIDYKNKSVFVEVVKPERIVFDHLTGPKFRTSVQFTEQGNDTLITLQMRFGSAEELKKTIETFKADAGLKQTIDRLEGYLSRMSFAG